MIIFVGDKPSKKNLDPEIPFVGTQSYKTLLNWIFIMNVDVTEVCLYNKHSPDLSYWKDQHFKNYRPILFIALGDEAEKQLKIERITRYYKLPHPSGLNRKLNDKQWLQEQLEGCEVWINEQKLHYNKY